MVELHDDTFHGIWLGACPERAVAPVMPIDQVIDRVVWIIRRIGKDRMARNIDLAGESAGFSPSFGSSRFRTPDELE